LAIIALLIIIYDVYVGENIGASLPAAFIDWQKSSKDVIRGSLLSGFIFDSIFLL